MSKLRIHILLVPCLLLAGATSSAQKCSECDCYHFPIPETCDKCCGVAQGKITSVSNSSVEITEKGSTADAVTVTKTFALKPDTKKNGVLQPGAPATVYYRKQDKVATQVDIIDAIEGLLQPANEPDPPGPPFCALLPAQALKVHLGSSLGWTTSDDVTVLQIKDTEVLGLRRTLNGMAVRAKVFSEDGKVVAQIIDNHFYVNPDNFFRIDRPDSHSLVVYDRHRMQVLNVRYLNPYSVSVLGMFQFPGASPVVITQNAMLIGRSVLQQACAGNSRILWMVN